MNYRAVLQESSDRCPHLSSHWHQIIQFVCRCPFTALMLNEHLTNFLEMNSIRVILKIILSLLKFMTIESNRRESKKRRRYINNSEILKIEILLQKEYLLLQLILSFYKLQSNDFTNCKIND